MSFTKKIFTLLPVSIFLCPSLLSCNNNSSANKGYVLKVLNSEDYIYKQDGEDTLPDLTVQFEQYILETEGIRVQIVYDTFDTMENMYNTLYTGKTSYDLVCGSEYMIQKLYSTGYQEGKSNSILSKIDQNKVPNYDNYCSNFIRDKLKGITLNDGDTLDDYTNCYMWGTLGILYNPTYEKFVERNYSAEEVIEDMQDWNILWDKKYNNTISIKDSMRDTYAIGLMRSFEEELNNAESYEERNVIFNYGGFEDKDAKSHVKAVQNELLELRKNIFGFEVDSGKEDIVTGKIGIDTAWSGDAVYSMDQAEEERQIDLYYSVPKQGTNVWFDCWAMTNTNSESKEADLAYKFLNFLSDPINSIQNMEYIGYTSSIASEETFEYFTDIYSLEDEEEGEAYDLSYFFSKDNDDESDYVINADPYYAERQLHAQFPKAEEIDSLMIMKDYGKNSDLILKMWQEVKHDPLPTWAIVLFVVEGIAIIGGALTYVIIKKKNKIQRASRRQKNAH